VAVTSVKAIRVAPSGRGRVWKAITRRSLVRASPLMAARAWGSDRPRAPEVAPELHVVQQGHAELGDLVEVGGVAQGLGGRFQNRSKASLCRRSRPSEPNTATASLSLSSVPAAP
jgi:hypothetical protein